MSELTLNEKYAMTCKEYGIMNTPFGTRFARAEEPWGDCPDYLSSDAELGAMVRALIKIGILEFCDSACGYCRVTRNDGKDNYLGNNLNEAAASACIALKLRVEGGLT